MILNHSNSARTAPIRRTCKHSGIVELRRERQKSSPARRHNASTTWLR